MKPLIGITADLQGGHFHLKRHYAEMVAAAGGIPVVLPALVPAEPELLERLDGFLLSGGDDVDTRAFGRPLHEAARLVDPRRQAFETSLLQLLEQAPAAPVLGVCLGMQLMGLVAGGILDQHLPDRHAGAAGHYGDRRHEVEGEIGTGLVCSHHHQALEDAGRLAVVGRSPDGIIEAVADHSRPFYVGVQWHPERTADPALGAGIIARLVASAAARRR